ncbi:MAG: hypothetical protein R8F63_00135 [Acidimicrobiales bacterium]|nr:hypothetical protein [Acidimicrobiales bacterium]
MSESATDIRNRIEYRRDMVPAIAGYGALLAVALAVVGDEVDSVFEWALMLSPLLPAMWGVRAVVRQLRRVDEYQRTLQLEAMAAGFAAAMIAALTLGFLGVAGVASRSTGWIVYGAGMATWAVVAFGQARA